jgi:glucose/arabinose dehydrogenase
MFARIQPFAAGIILVLVPLGAHAQEPGRGIVPLCVATAGEFAAAPNALVKEDPEAIPVNGGETLAWEYAGALGGLELPGFVAYIDDRRVTLPNVSCAAADSGFGRTCRARLPALTPGAHAIQVAAVSSRGAQVVEGIRSTSIRVRFAARPLEAGAAVDRIRETVTADGVHLRAEMVATGFTDPTDLALLPDGRVLISERSSRILQCRQGAMLEHPAAFIPDLVTGDGKGLLALAADADFEKSGAVFAVYTATRGARLVRLIDAGTGLGPAAVLLDELPLAETNPAASLRMGPDRKLYLALDDGGDPSRAEDLGSYEGKVLRLNPDGTTPRDQPQHSPVFAAGVNRPAGMAWQSGSRLWVVSGDAPGGDRLLSIASEEAGSGHIESRFVLPPGSSAGGVIYYHSGAIPAFRGNVFVAASRGESLLRVHAGDRPAEALFRDSMGPFIALAVTEDGALYALTAAALWRISVQ